MKYSICLLIAAVITLAGRTSSSQAGVLLDDINGNATPGFFVFFDETSTDLNLGWFYSPTTAYNLDRIETTFRAVPNAGAFSRPVTLSIWDAHPGSGGSLLESGSFNVGNGGGVQGISFPEFTLAAGQNYFIGLQNIRGLGINIVQPINNNFGQGQPPGTEFLNGWYFGTGSSFSTFVPLATGDPNVPNNPFAAPIFRFYGNPIPPAAVPEPSSLMIIAGFGLFALVRPLRRAFGQKSPASLG
ncbi:MAG: PEP-CTERM sorting domain-containing protein [Pirellulaceae bacterium]|nr:PEP-CTERM sorting domain-containing protein [Pirellulaceae bacterium]